MIRILISADTGHNIFFVGTFNCLNVTTAGRHTVWHIIAGPICWGICKGLLQSK